MLKQLLAVFQAGKTVANPAAWKSGQVTANMVAAVLSFLLLLLKGTPYDPQMDDQTVLLLAGGIFGLLNWLFTVASTDKIGITGRAPAVAGAPGQPAQGNPAAAPAAVASPAAEPVRPDPVRRQPGDPLNTDSYLPG